MVTVNNPKDERNNQVEILEKFLGDTGESCRVIGIMDGLHNLKIGSSKNIIVGDKENFSVTISG